ncbi:MAG: bifunctional diaminohydroxyphosphoribosylaminopyrimidine deaminase/5-amino-6-(5-phosphoribosylamino)uracil reductase RibD [Candidatus Omnitrophica bacterium]|nr:bifunctional diaminohydroxyphosphoribosylaminopyrimidine deaminase/5-amino-6-(5-phosphoribosylamino)uracil reductase RibD [Candidatus Omnitrophota bacterium]
MIRAIKLAERAKGRTFPNPLVGAVIVKNGKIVGEGYHRRFGSSHAEVMALREAKKKARDADMYVTLEPCAHYGNTPPCVKAIIKSGIKRVYASMKDPNPLVCGKGFNILKGNGIIVKSGMCRREAQKLNGVYSEYIKKIKRVS